MTSCWVSYANSISRCVVMLGIYVAWTSAPGFSEIVWLVEWVMAVSSRSAALLRELLRQDVCEMPIRQKLWIAPERSPCTWTVQGRPSHAI